MDVDTIVENELSTEESSTALSSSGGAGRIDAMAHAGLVSKVGWIGETVETLSQKRAAVPQVGTRGKVKIESLTKSFRWLHQHSFLVSSVFWFAFSAPKIAAFMDSVTVDSEALDAFKSLARDLRPILQLDDVRQTNDLVLTRTKT